jgi:hypothetical protein
VHKSGWRGSALNVRAVVRFRATPSDRTTGEPSYRAAWKGGSTRRWSTALVTVVVAAVGSISLLALGGLAATPASAASGAPAVTQCNPPDFPTGIGYQVTCNVTVDNYTNASGGTISTVTTSACLAAAGVVYPSCPLNLGPVVTTTNSLQLVTSVNQCNGIVNGAGSNVYCNVTVTNHVPPGTPEAGVTTNQCIGSAGGGGSTQACTPLGSTTNATVTQCNGSANGGGTYAGQPAVGCTVTGADSALPVSINQCNGTSNGGGSAATCMATVADVFTTASTTSTPAATGTTGTGGSAAAGGIGGGSGGAVGAGGSTGTGSGAAGATGIGSGVGGSTGTVAAVIPTGAPQTGIGGASLSTSPALVYVGGIALTAAGLTMVLALRRRRAPVASSRQSHLS